MLSRTSQITFELMSEGAFKGCRSGRSNAPWGWTQLNGCPQRMKEKLTFDFDYVSILQNATTCHKVDFNSDSNVFCFPTITPPPMLSFRTIVKVGQIPKARLRLIWLAHLSVDEFITTFSSWTGNYATMPSFLNPTDTFPLSGTATQLTPTISESYFSLICHQSGNFVFDFL